MDDSLIALGVNKSLSSNLSCQNTLCELNLVKEWPNRILKRVLYNLKCMMRKMEEEQEVVGDGSDGGWSFR